MFPKVPFKNMIFIMTQQIDQAFPAQETGSSFGNAGNLRKMLQSFKWMGLAQRLCPCIPNF
jgi:hypothetical protein